jgi:hypothetical protein
MTSHLLARVMLTVAMCRRRAQGRGIALEPILYSTVLHVQMLCGRLYRAYEWLVFLSQSDLERCDGSDVPLRANGNGLTS